MDPVKIEMDMFEPPTSSMVASPFSEEFEQSPVRCYVAALVVGLFIPVVTVILLTLKLIEFV